MRALLPSGLWSGEMNGALLRDNSELDRSSVLMSAADAVNKAPICLRSKACSPGVLSAWSVHFRQID